MSLSFETFAASFDDGAPPAEASAPLVALWWVQRGEWDRAHAIVQDGTDKASAWVHAHLHRIEGDLGNATYWYRHAGRPVAQGPLEAERTAIATNLLASSR